MKKCWVCLRITPELALKLAHQVWVENPKIAREIGLKASELIEQFYQENPTFFCGLSDKSVLSGLFYLLGFQHQAFKSMKEIARATNTSEQTMKQSYRKWFNASPLLFPGFKFERVYYESGSYGLYPTFKGKRVNRLLRERRLLNE